MADKIGRVDVLYPPRSSAATVKLPLGWNDPNFPAVAQAQFPLLTDYPVTVAQDWPVVTHRFGELGTLATQRYQVGIGARRFHFQRNALSFAERAALIAFYNSVQGSLQSFTYAHATEEIDGATVRQTPVFEIVRVIFDTPPLSVTHLASMCKTGFDLIECPDLDDDALINGVNSFGSIGTPVPRFPPSGSILNSGPNPALMEQVQVLIPLITIRVRESAVPTIYLSDRRVTIDNQLYLPRLLNVGEDGSDIIMSQDIRGSADTVQFTFGNADRVMSQLNVDTGLKFAIVSFSLFHVQTSIVFNLWKGIVISFTADGSPTFKMTCSDGLYPITQNYPRRTLSRQCWKPFNKEIYPGYTPCPWALKSGVGNPDTCDYFFNSPNGCISHGMTSYFGGHPAFPQSVLIHDEGTGHLSIDWSPWMLLSPAFGGLGRATDKVTSTSIIADNVWGKPLPEIWCNASSPSRAFWANATIIATRDESDFQNNLGIVGAGPLGGYEGMGVQENADGFKFLVSPLVDGFPPHGFKTDSQLAITDSNPNLYGIRWVLGTDPANTTTDVFALGQGHGTQFWLVKDPVWGEIPPYAAGTAFVELRYSKDHGKGITPSPTNAHAMQVPIKFGVTGVIYDGGGNRAFVGGLTNPFWVAVSTYLRALGIDQASESVQLSTFDLTSAVTAGFIADLDVTPLTGDLTVTEKQFVFQGVLAEFKPYRDWLTEILTCALGYFTFEYGRLRLGIRNDSSATSAFSLGNMLFQSLSLTPAESAFEYLKVNFANVDLQGQEDYVEYNDKDHAEYFGRLGAPLTSEQRMVGLSALSQGLRVVATRVREEIGGILRPDLPNPYIEWDNNFIATWKTTLLALETGVGHVVSVTHPDIPSYPGPVAGSPAAANYIFHPPNTWDYRIQKWTLHKDYSITIVAKSVTDSMYDLAVGPKPVDVLPLPLPALFFAIPRGPAWAPYQVQAAVDDAIFPSEWTFSLEQQYTTLADGSSSASLIATGKLPVNHFSPGVGTPSISGIQVSPLGGVIPPGTTYRATIVAYDASGLPSPPAEIALVQIPDASAGSPWGGATNSFSFTGVVWPATAGLVSYTVFLSDKDALICGQQSGALTLSTVPGVPPNTYTPSTIDILGPFLRSTYSLPSPFVSRLRLKAKLCPYPGILTAAVTSVSTDTIVCDSLIDSTPGALDLTGRTLSIIGRPVAGGATPFASYLITAHNPASGTLTVTPDPDGTVLAADILTVRTQIIVDNALDLTQAQDLGYSNSTNAYAGIPTVSLVGKIIRVVAGLGRGERRKIFSNTLDQIAWDLDLHLDSTSVWVVEEPDWAFSADSTVFDNSDPTKSTALAVEVANLSGSTLLIAGFTVSTNDEESPDGDCPNREVWVFGDPGSLGSGVTINDIPVIVPVSP